MYEQSIPPSRNMIDHNNRVSHIPVSYSDCPLLRQAMLAEGFLCFPQIPSEYTRTEREYGLQV